MEIKVTPDMKITSSTFNYTLSTLRIATRDTKVLKQGDEYWQDLAYYPSLDSALSGFVEHSIRRSDVTTFDELKALLADLRAILSEIKGTLEP